MLCEHFNIIETLKYNQSPAAPMKIIFLPDMITMANKHVISNCICHKNLGISHIFIFPLRNKNTLCSSPSLAPVPLRHLVWLTCHLWFTELAQCLQSKRKTFSFKINFTTLAFKYSEPNKLSIKDCRILKILSSRFTRLNHLNVSQLHSI